MSKYSPQHPVLKHTQSVFFPWRESNTLYKRAISQLWAIYFEVFKVKMNLEGSVLLCIDMKLYHIKGRM
jgi:hypothetical protein